MKIAFLIGSEKISGGTYVIFEHALRISKIYNNMVYILTEHKVDINKDLEWYPEAKQLKWETVVNCKESFDLVIGTWWRTVYELYRIKSQKYCYFVQSIESRFYSRKDEESIRKLADSTYIIGLPVITEATWIQEYLYKYYGVNATLVKNGIRKDIYTINGVTKSPRLQRGKLRVLVEGPLGVNFKNTEKSLELAKKSLADEVWLLTSSAIKTHPSADKVFSQLSIFETAEVYRSCDVIIKLSYVEGMFGPPLEIFHCGGTAVVYNVTGVDEYIINDYNAFIISRDDEESVIKHINMLKHDPDLLDTLKANAIDTANNWNGWELSSKQFSHAVDAILEQNTLNQEQLKEKSGFLFDWYIMVEQNRNKTYFLFKKFIKKIIRRA